MSDAALPLPEAAREGHGTTELPGTAFEGAFERFADGSQPSLTMQSEANEEREEPTNAAAAAAAVAAAIAAAAKAERVKLTAAKAAASAISADSCTDASPHATSSFAADAAHFAAEASSERHDSEQLERQVTIDSGLHIDGYPDLIDKGRADGRKRSSGSSATTSLTRESSKFEIRLHDSDGKLADCREIDMGASMSEPSSRRLCQEVDTSPCRSPSWSRRPSQSHSFGQRSFNLSGQELSRRPSQSHSLSSSNSQSSKPSLTTPGRSKLTEKITESLRRPSELSNFGSRIRSASFSANDLQAHQLRCERRPSHAMHASEIPLNDGDNFTSMTVGEALQQECSRLACAPTSRSYENDRRTERMVEDLTRFQNACSYASVVPEVGTLASSVPEGDELMKQTSQQDDTFSNISDETRRKYMGQVGPMKWGLTVLSAVAIALQAIATIMGSHALVEWKLQIIRLLLDIDLIGYILAYGFLLMYGLGAGMISAIIVTYIAPHAGGGGIPEVKAFLNGVEMPQAFTLRTWVARSISLLLVTSAGFFAGPEGPFVHLGALVGAGVLRGPRWRGRLRWPVVLSGHRNRCEFIAQGAAIGVAAAFGAPIGGVLFCFEEAATFWSHALTWRTFVGCLIAVVITKVIKGGFTELSMNSFVEFPDASADFEPWELLAFAALAAVTGFLGGLFCLLVGLLARARRQIFQLTKPTVASRRARVAEVMTIALVTLSVCFWLPVAVGCRPLDSASGFGLNRRLGAVTGDLPLDLSGNVCPDGEYSELGFILLQPKEIAVRALFTRKLDNGAAFSIHALLGASMLIYAFTLITFGSAIPAGLFIPNILAGACLGRAVGAVFDSVGFDVHPGIYALMGSTGMLSGFSRMTIALGIIMLEITNNMRLLVPIALVILVSKAVADRISPGLNHVILDLNPNVNLLEDALSEDHLLVLESLLIHDACTAEVFVLREREPTQVIVNLLQRLSFSGYPVVDHDLKILGLVTRLQLVACLASESAVRSGMVDVRAACSSPEITSWNTPCSRAFNHFRAAGLQHLCVVDESNRLLGILTRTDMSRMSRSGKEGVEEVRSLLHRKQAAAAAGLTMGSSARWGSKEKSPVHAKIRTASSFGIGPLPEGDLQLSSPRQTSQSSKNVLNGTPAKATEVESCPHSPRSVS